MTSLHAGDLYRTKDYVLELRYSCDLVNLKHMEKIAGDTVTPIGGIELHLSRPRRPEKIRRRGAPATKAGQAGEKPPPCPLKR